MGCLRDLYHQPHEILIGVARLGTIPAQHQQAVLLVICAAVTVHPDGDRAPPVRSKQRRVIKHKLVIKRPADIEPTGAQVPKLRPISSGQARQARQSSSPSRSRARRPLSLRPTKSSCSAALLALGLSRRLKEVLNIVRVVNVFLLEPVSYTHLTLPTIYSV